MSEIAMPRRSDLPPTILDEPVRGTYPEPELLGLTGLDQLRSYLQRQGPMAPIGHLTGMRIEEVSFNACSFSMPASPWWLLGTGMFLGGTLATVGDAALGCAILAAVPPGMAIATAELSMNFVRAATPDSERLVAHGGLIHAGHTLGLSDVVVEDAGGNLLAHGTSRCVVFPVMTPPPEPPDSLPPLDEPTYDSPDPYERPVVGELIPQETWDRLTGLEVYEAWWAGQLPAAPVYYLTGMRAVEAEEGRLVMTMPASEWFATAARTVQGGFLAMLADAALGGAVQTTAPAGAVVAPLDLSVNFLRPVFPDGTDLVARARVVHRGRTIAVANAEIVNAEGKRVVVAKGTSMVLADRPWSTLVRQPSPDGVRHLED